MFESPPSRAGRCRTTEKTRSSPAPLRLAAPALAGAAAPKKHGCRARHRRARGPPTARAAGAAALPGPTPPAEIPQFSAAPETGSYQRTLRGAGHQQQPEVKLSGAPEKGISALPAAAPPRSRRFRIFPANADQASARGRRPPAKVALRPSAAAARVPSAARHGAGRGARVLEPAGPRRGPQRGRWRCSLGSSSEGRGALLRSLCRPGSVPQ